MGVHRRSRSREQGAAAVEFALVLPILLLVVFGAITFGLIFASQLSLNSAARDAARAGVVQALNGSGLTCQQIATQARSQVSPLGGKAADVKVTVTAPDGTTQCVMAKGATTVSSNGTTTMCTNSNSYSGQLVVQLDYTANSPVPLIPAATSVALSSKGSFTCEYS